MLTGLRVVISCAWVAFCLGLQVLVVGKLAENETMGQKIRVLHELGSIVWDFVVVG